MVARRTTHEGCVALELSLARQILVLHPSPQQKTLPSGLPERPPVCFADSPLKGAKGAGVLLVPLLFEGGGTKAPVGGKRAQEIPFPRPMYVAYSSSSTIST